MPFQGLGHTGASGDAFGPCPAPQLVLVPRPEARPLDRAETEPAFASRCSMNTEDGAKLYDVCPHVSDSVSGAGALRARQGRGRPGTERVASPGHTPLLGEAVSQKRAESIGASL